MLRHLSFTEQSDLCNSSSHFKEVRTSDLLKSSDTIMYYCHCMKLLLGACSEAEVIVLLLDI